MTNKTFSVLISGLFLVFGCTTNTPEKEGLPENKKLATGIGVISINYTSNGQEDSILNFFNSMQDSIPVYHSTIKELDEELCLDDEALGLNPLEFMPTPGRIIFRCVDSTAQAYKVVVNEKAAVFCWIKKTGNVVFGNWLVYLQGGDYIQTKMPLRERPDDKAPVILKKDSCGSYQVLAIKDDWIEVQTSGFCNLYGDKPEVQEIKGWIKWAEGNKLLVGRMYTE